MAALSAARAASGSLSQRAERRSSDDKRCSASPALEPGVITRTSVLPAKRASSGAPMRHASSPVRRCSQSASAICSGLRVSSGAAQPSTQGRKRPGSKSGNASSKLGRSPFTSITSTGTPVFMASSITTVVRPVFPEPVMPTTTP